jgi:hypothetical protein
MPVFYQPFFAIHVSFPYLLLVSSAKQPGLHPADWLEKAIGLTVCLKSGAKEDNLQKKEYS